MPDPQSQQSVVQPGRAISICAAFVALAAAVALGHALSLSYVSDDAFVSFRYAKNLAGGLGLVYNAAERVEGYTNFLWTVVIASAMKIGFDPVPFSTGLGIVFLLLTILLYGVLSLRSHAGIRGPLAVVPLTSLALCLHRDICAHATSGMETAMFTFLVSAAFALLLLGRSPRALVGAGGVLVLAMMTRPDGILVLAAAALYVLVCAERPLRSCALLLVPSVAVFLPYWIWRWTYYGYFFPNTFYAKSVAHPYVSQGWLYAWLYVKTYYVFAIPVMLGIALLARAASRGTARLFSRGAPRPVLLASFIVVLYTGYIVWIGGDFMFARFFIPLTPVLYFAAESLIVQLPWPTAAASLSGLLLLGTAFRNDLYTDKSFVGYVADEARYFTVDEPLDEARRYGERLRRYFSGMPVRLAFWAGQLRVAYYADPPVAIEASAGLTDVAIAHQPLTARGRPGHEKNATLDYLMRRKVHFYIGPTDPPPAGQVVLNLIEFDTTRARIIVYDRAVMSALERHPEVRFVRLPDYLDDYARHIDAYPQEKVAQDYAFLKRYYFDHNSDTARERPFRKRLAGAGSPGG